MTIEEMVIRELTEIGMPDYRTISIDEQRLHLATLRDKTSQAAFAGMFGFDESLDALLRAAFMRGIERGRVTNVRWDDEVWLDDEVEQTRILEDPQRT